jgi:hypothetical protein
MNCRYTKHSKKQIFLKSVHFYSFVFVGWKQNLTWIWIQSLGPKQWRSTGNRILPWNRMMGLAFFAVADLLATYETSREFWHAAAIAGHSSFSKIFPLSNGERSILRDQQVYSVSQLLEVNDLTGRLTVDENVALLTGLANFPHLQHKLRLLVRSMRRAPVVDKFVTPITTAT